MQVHEYNKMYDFENNYWWYKGLHELVEFYIRRLSVKHILNILDAGCGTGRFVQIAKKYGIVEGLDYSSTAVAFCTKRGLDNCRVCDLNEWQPTESAYDTIISLDVLCCEGIEDDGVILGKFYSSLKINGMIILNLPAFPFLRRTHDIAVSISRRYYARNLVSRMHKHGFKVIYVTYRLPALFFIILMRRLWGNLSRKNDIESDLTTLPCFINNLFLFFHRLENKLITKGVRFPIGASIFLIAMKI